MPTRRRKLASRCVRPKCWSSTDGIKRERIDDLSGDFPRRDDRFALHPYRHGYFAAKGRKAAVGAFDTLVHRDFKTNLQRTYSVPPGDAFSEPVFAPAGAEAAEGEGYLLATIYRGTERRSELAIFDAMALEKGPIALAELSHHVTLGFHGNWRAAT
jgi:carotenoid cleavage dioxygenase-like enzyme